LNTYQEVWRFRLHCHAWLSLCTDSYLCQSLCWKLGGVI